MADDADRAQQDADVYAANLETAFELEEGTRGICWACEEPSQRLIQGKCAPCRDKALRNAQRTSYR